MKENFNPAYDYQHSVDSSWPLSQFIKKELKPTLNRDEGCELSKIYDSLLPTPSSIRTPPPSRSKGSSVSQSTLGYHLLKMEYSYSEIFGS